jgi:hypothetical protein
LKAIEPHNPHNPQHPHHQPKTINAILEFCVYQYFSRLGLILSLF